MADMSDCHRCDIGLEGTAMYTFFCCPKVRPFWDHVGKMTVRVNLEYFDFAYVYDNVSTRSLVETNGVSVSRGKNCRVDDAESDWILWVSVHD